MRPTIAFHFFLMNLNAALRSRRLVTYLHAWETGSEARAGVRKWIEFYNHKGPHSSLGGNPPAVAYWQRIETTNPDQQVQRVA
jgi:transposase InsO family protein